MTKRPLGRALFRSPGRRLLEAEFAVGRLAAALPGMPLFLVQQVNRWCRDGFVDVAAAQAGAICPIPVSFDNHRSTAARAGAGQRVVHGAVLPGPCGLVPRARAIRKRQVSNHGLSNAYGVSCRVRAERLPYKSVPPLSGHRSIHPAAAAALVPPLTSTRWHPQLGCGLAWPQSHQALFVISGTCYDDVTDCVNGVRRFLWRFVKRSRFASDSGIAPSSRRRSRRLRTSDARPMRTSCRSSRRPPGTSPNPPRGAARARERDRRRVGCQRPQ